MMHKKNENHAELHVFHSMFVMKTKICSDFQVFNGMHLSVTTLNFFAPYQIFSQCHGARLKH